MNATVAPKVGLGRKAGRTIALVLAATVVLVVATPRQAAAASFDPRIKIEAQVKCLGDTFGLTPSVRVTQPWVIGTRSSYETIKWMPYLQRWDPARGWQHLLRSTNWLQFSATWQGPSIYWYTNQPKVFVFSNLARGYYYRIIHVVQWTSTGELGSMPSDYRTSRGHCLL